MFLATTALTEFWGAREETLFLGPWCLPHRRRSTWTNLEPRVLPSPWNEPETSRQALAEAASAYESLLHRLANDLNKIHGTDHDLRYWRILLGPWLLGYVSSFCDRNLHMRTALEISSSPHTAIMDPSDYITPRDTAQANRWRVTDRFNLQLYSQIALGLGIPVERRRPHLPSLEGRPIRRWKSVAYDALFRTISSPRRTDVRAYFSDLYIDRRKTLSLIAASGFRIAPVLKELAPDLPSMPLDPSLRRKLIEGAPAVKGGLEELLIAALPIQLPSIFLEGYAALRDLVLDDWPRLPELLATSTGFFSNEYFKMLAAESTERGGRLVIAQHGGGYGMQALRENERHERVIADVYATWGWKDDFVQGAELKPLPNPRLTPRRSGPSTTDFLLICGTLPRYPYSWYFAEKTVSHRFDESLAWRLRFVDTLPPSFKSRLNVRLHPEDFGWDQRLRLEERHPDLQFDNGGPWTKPGRFGLVVIDHPQTSMLESLALDIPTLLFWDPELWPMRPSAQSHFDELRHTGILYDQPETAAAWIAKMGGDPGDWWRSEAVQKTRERFCRSFALGDRDWASTWSRTLGLQAGHSTPSEHDKIKTNGPLQP